MPNHGTIGTAVATCLSCKASEILLKKSAVAGVKHFIHSDAFDYFVASAVYTVCLGVSAYGVTVSAPLVYKHNRAFVGAVKPAIAESMEAAENAV